MKRILLLLSVFNFPIVILIYLNPGFVFFSFFVLFLVLVLFFDTRFLCVAQGSFKL
jgi:hypothetical protein